MTIPINFKPQLIFFAMKNCFFFSRSCLLCINRISAWQFLCRRSVGMRKWFIFQAWKWLCTTLQTASQHKASNWVHLWGTEIEEKKNLSVKTDLSMTRNILRWNASRKCRVCVCVLKTTKCKMQNAIGSDNNKAHFRNEIHKCKKQQTAAVNCCLRCTVLLLECGKYETI